MSNGHLSARFYTEADIEQFIVRLLHACGFVNAMCDLDCERDDMEVGCGSSDDDLTRKVFGDDMVPKP